MALSLWALSNNREPALKYLTTNSSPSNAQANPFLLGYQHLRNALNYGSLDDLVLAKAKLLEAIDQHSYVAPSYYFLAFMEERQGEDQSLDHDKLNDHLKHAMEYLNEGIAYDPKFSSLYLSRALVYVLQDKTEAALDDLVTATKRSWVHCLTIIENGPKQSHPLSRISREPRFQSF